MAASAGSSKALLSPDASGLRVAETRTEALRCGFQPCKNRNSA